MREGRQNTRIWLASMLTSVRKTSAQNGGAARVQGAGGHHEA